MTTAVQKHPSRFALASVRTGLPVNTAGMSRVVDELSFLHGAAVQECGGAIVWPRPTGRVPLENQDYTVPLSYVRSRAVKVVRVCCELYPALLDVTNPVSTVKVTVTLPTGATWIQANGLDGSVDFDAPPPGRITYPVITGWVDVSGMTTGALGWFLVQSLRVAGSGVPGLQRVYLAESPLVDFDPAYDPATEPAMNSAGATAGKRIENGGSSSDTGVERVWHLLDAARTQWFRHFQLAGIEGADTEGPTATPYWYVTGNTWDNVDFLHWRPPVSPRSVQWYLTPRMMVPATGNSWDWVIRYRTRDVPLVTTAPKVRLHWQSSVTTGNSGDITLPLSGTFTTFTQAVTLAPIADPGDYVQVWMVGNADDGMVNFSNITLVERLA